MKDKFTTCKVIINYRHQYGTNCVDSKRTFLAACTTYMKPLL